MKIHAISEPPALRRRSRGVHRWRKAGGSLLLVLFVPCLAHADEAPTHDGRPFTGKLVFDGTHGFVGKKSLLVDAATGETSVAIAVSQEKSAARRLTMHFFDPMESGGATIRCVFRDQVEVKLVLDGAAYSLAGAKA